LLSAFSISQELAQSYKNAYPVERHIQAFEYMARALSGSTHTVVASFIDLYEKTKQ
jgi:hypothetical protein